MVPDPVGVGPEDVEMFWNHTLTLQYQENLVDWTHKVTFKS